MARVRVQTNLLPDGRWSVRDVEMGYRICNFYQHHKDPDAPSHIHYPEDRYLASCQIRTATEARHIMAHYRAKRSAFHLASFQESVHAHRDHTDPDRPPDT